MYKYKYDPAQSIHPDIFLSSSQSTIHFGAARSPVRVSRKHPILHAQVTVTHALEHAAQLERPGDDLLAVEEITHLQYIAKQPRRQNRNPETLARAGAVVGHDLWEGEGSLDGEADVTQEIDVEF